MGMLYGIPYFWCRPVFLYFWWRCLVWRCTDRSGSILSLQWKMRDTLLRRFQASVIPMGMLYGIPYFWCRSGFLHFWWRCLVWRCTNRRSLVGSMLSLQWRKRDTLLAKNANTSISRFQASVISMGTVKLGTTGWRTGWRTGRWSLFTLCLTFGFKRRDRAIHPKHIAINLRCSLCVWN